MLFGFLTVFSYAYVDLNLTLSKSPLVLSFVSRMQNLGYYHRTTASLIYSLFLAVAFIQFAVTLYLVYRKKIGKKYLIASTIATTLISIFAYPYLSADLFNYLFDAKIILNYHANPYTHRPLDFPNDEWLRFMRWVHRYSPYGPVWLLLSVVPSVLGFGKFVITLFNFKVLMAAFHLLNCLIIYKILFKLNPKNQMLGTSFYALNPLVLIEGVVNAHNDVVLATFILLPVYLLSNQKPLLSILANIIGTLVKYIPAINLPWLILEFFSNKPNLKRYLVLNLISLALSTFIFSSFKVAVPFISSGSTQIQFQPWYLFWTLPLVAVIVDIRLMILATSICVGASFRYLPYLFYGDWSHPGTILFMQLVTLIPLILVSIIVSFKKYSKGIDA